ALAVAGVLDLRDDSGKALIDVITEHLANRRALLVIDNCERVIDEAAQLANSLLEHCGLTTLLATSRENLGVTGEQTYALGSMSMPATPDLPAAQSSDAVRLFVDRARLGDPAFTVDAANAETVVEICRRLDGIPLAIELAAARVKMLSVEQIRAKLDDRFRLLTGGKRALPRHQTMEAAIHWSYEQLPPEEQKLLCQLAVFVGGWTLAGATQVAGEGGDELEMLNRLTRLADKSLVVTARNGEAVRYSMLETVRQYAAQRLDESGGTDASRTRHLDFCLTLVADAETGPDLSDETWGARIDKERENLLAAHRWCDHAPERADAGLRLVAGWVDYFMQRGLAALGFPMFVEATERTAARAPTRLRYCALRNQSLLASEIGHYAASQLAMAEALDIARQLDDPVLVAHTLIRLVDINTILGRLEQAENLLSEVLPIATSIGGRILMHARHCMADLRRNEGNLDSAKALYEEVLRFHREQWANKVSKRWVSTELSNLAWVALTRGDAREARARTRESLATARQCGWMRGTWYLIDLCSAVMAASREWTLSARLHGFWNSVVEATEMRAEPVDVAVIDPLLERAREALGEARFAEEEATGRTLTLDQAVAAAEAWLDQSTA
ncbi:MAG: ATP-binding protein, partial [Burkholderiales bacterium]